MYLPIWGQSVSAPRSLRGGGGVRGSAPRRKFCDFTMILTIDSKPKLYVTLHDSHMRHTVLTCTYRVFLDTVLSIRPDLVCDLMVGEGLLSRNPSQGNT